MTVFIFTTGDRAAAETKAGFWTERGHKVQTFGPADVVQLTGDAAPKTVWDSGPDKDWFVVVAERKLAAAAKPDTAG